MKLNKAEQYNKSKLTTDMLDDNPFKQFEKWYLEAQDSDILIPNAFSLATVSDTAMPSVRTVLLKYFDEEGFVFYTNYSSQKAKELDANPQAALLFPWLELERQVRINGRVEKVSAAQSFKYFSSRPRESQLAAWCSNQSSVISSRQMLLSKFEEVKQRFKSGVIPLPSFWGGYRIVPESFEFWQGRTNRMHDRFQYSKSEKEWTIQQLAP